MRSIFSGSRIAMHSSTASIVDKHCSLGCFLKRNRERRELTKETHGNARKLWLLARILRAVYQVPSRTKIRGVRPSALVTAPMRGVATGQGNRIIGTRLGSVSKAPILSSWVKSIPTKDRSYAKVSASSFLFQCVVWLRRGA